jgi:hypothetical protein
MLSSNTYFDIRPKQNDRAVNSKSRRHFTTKDIPSYPFLSEAEWTPRILNAARRNLPTEPTGNRTPNLLFLALGINQLQHRSPQSCVTKEPKWRSALQLLYLSVSSDKIWNKNHLCVNSKFSKIRIVRSIQDPFMKNKRKTRQPLSVQTLDTRDTIWPITLCSTSKPQELTH